MLTPPDANEPESACVGAKTCAAVRRPGTACGASARGKCGPARGTRPAVIIGIGGGTASGKSWLANYLARELGGQAAVVSQDWYYKDCVGMEPARLAAWNFDHPDAFDTPLLVAHLDALRRGEPVDAPRYDYATHARLPALRLDPVPLVILEGILVLHEPPVRRRLDRAVFVDTPADVRLHRRLARDAAERALPPEESRRLYETFASPMHDGFVQPSARRADHVWRSLAEPAFPAQLATEIRNLL